MGWGKKNLVVFDKTWWNLEGAGAAALVFSNGKMNPRLPEVNTCGSSPRGKTKSEIGRLERTKISYDASILAGLRCSLDGPKWYRLLIQTRQP